MLETNEYVQLFISSDSNLLDAFRQMDLLGTKLLMVGDTPHFERFISVGDIQRAIIAGMPMDTQLRELAPRVNMTVDDKVDVSEVKSKMLRYRAPYMPIVDARSCVRGIYTWEQLFESTAMPPRTQLRDVPVVIMAGGLGTRLRPLTNVIPKPLIPVGNKSMLEHILDRFSAVGCGHFYLTVNHLADVLRYYVKHQTVYNEKISYIEESFPLGTAGSLRLLADKLDGTFFVTNCDILIDQDYSEIYDYHKSSRNVLTMVTALRHHRVAYGTVESNTEGQLTKLVEKPELTFSINAGMYILEAELLDRIPGDRVFHITELMEALLSDGQRVGVFPVSEGSWHDIGVWPEYLKIKDKLLS